MSMSLLLLCTRIWDTSSSWPPFSETVSVEKLVKPDLEVDWRNRSVTAQTFVHNTTPFLF